MLDSSVNHSRVSTPLLRTRARAGARALRGGSFLTLSFLIHLALGGALAVVLSQTESAVIDVPVEEYMDLGYEQLEEPPEPVAAPKPVPVEAVENVPRDPAPSTDVAPRELQDESSTIAGTKAPEPAPVAAAPSSSAGGNQAPSAPYYKIKPKYPKAALMAGLEGHVDLRIDIREDGTVENIRSVGGPEADVFESEARRAVAKWKYQPFMDEQGHAIRKENHQVRVEFKLKDVESL